MEDSTTVSDPASLWPAWVAKRDGRLVPFDPDKISQALFAATETLGRPDAFLARELTDGVLHFLGREQATAIPTTAQVAELVGKVVRELGQPALAQAFAGGSASKAAPAGRGEVAVTFSPADPPDHVVRSCLRQYSLHAVFSRDLAAAQGDGLLTLTGLDTPLQLAACVAEAPGSGAADLAPVVCVDSPEYTVSPGEAAHSIPAAPLMVVNLNCAQVPPWAKDGPAGPLFAEPRGPLDPQELAARADAFLEELTLQPGVRIDWHVGDHDVPAAANPSPRLLRLARRAAEFPGLTFAFDRPRRAVALGEGLDRNHPAVLLAVGLHLPRLLALPGVAGSAEAFLQKLASLARLALSAAVQKREFLRRQGRAAERESGMARGFLLERARLLVVPVGLDAAVRVLAGCGLGEGKPALDLGRRILERLLAVLHQDGRRTNLDSVLDGPAAFSLANDPGPVAGAGVAGVTPWGAGLTAKQQLRTAGALHAAAEAGTAAVLLPDDETRQPDAIAELLRFALRQTDVVRLRFVRPGRQQQASLLP
jgi:hypothetical protein